MNTKPMKEWTYDEVMSEATWLVIQAIINGEPIRSAMYSADNMLTGWRKEKGMKL